MNKVVAFLEQYAQWVALGVASLFLLYVVYAYVLSDQLKVKVGSEAVLPEKVDPAISESGVQRLQSAMDTPAGSFSLPIKDFPKEFVENMNGTHSLVSPDMLASVAPVRPPIPGVEIQPTVAVGGVAKVTLPEAPAVVVTGTVAGNSMVVKPAPLLAEGEDPQQVPPPIDPSQLAPEVVLANALDKKWVTVEGKIDAKEFSAAWKKAFFVNGKPLQIPPQAMITEFLQLEVVREEQTGPAQWSNATTLKPLPLVAMKEYPKPGDREGQEIYRLWAETHQLDIIEPSFYRILKGDPWYIPSMGAPKDPNDMADANANQPFDPANPNIPLEKMTSEQKQQVYIYNHQKMAEEQKQRAAERRSKTEAAESSRRSSGGGTSTGGGGGRRIGGYAPLPIQLAANPGIPDDGNRGRGTPPGRTRPTDSGRPPINRTIPGRERPTVPGRDMYNRDMYNRPDYGRTNSTGPQLNPDGQIQNAAITGPFDPTRFLPDVKGVIPDILVWAHDDTVESGKTYRYKMRIKLKNPLYNTYGLTANPEDASKFALEGPWSDWKEVTAPRTTEYFFTAMRQQVGTKNVTSVTAAVYRHAKGEWSKETFTVAPGDAIGGMKSNTDYSTGATLVDLRPDTRERDLRILVSDSVGNITSVNLQSQISDPLYKSLEEKVNKPIIPGVGTEPAAVGNPALINEIGNR